ncbi:MAG: hypothetical protein PHV82_16485, partial [Victivallaceae bacterium]|nr:hypothetical protein [Victivallaceae bacterium]
MKHKGLEIEKQFEKKLVFPQGNSLKAARLLCRIVKTILLPCFLGGFLYGETIAAEQKNNLKKYPSWENSKLISSFETNEDIKRFSEKHAPPPDHYGSGVERSRDYVSDGNYSGKFIFNNNKSFYPSCGIKFDKAEDWSAYDYLEMDIFNDQDWPVRFTVVVNRGSCGFNLPARQRTHLAVNLRELDKRQGKYLKIQAVKKLWFWVRLPEKGVITVNIDNIRLSDKETAAKNIAFNKKSELKNTLNKRIGDIDRMVSDYENILKNNPDLNRALMLLLKNSEDLVYNIDQYNSQKLEADIDKIETDYLKLRMRAWKKKIFSKTGNNSGFALGTLDCMTKIFRDRPYSFNMKNKIDLAVAKNEYGAFQIVVIPNSENLKISKFEITDFVSDSGAVLSKNIFNYNFEAYLLPPKKARKGCLNYFYERSYTGPFNEPYPKDGWPDILLNRKASELGKDFIQPVWISFRTPGNAVPGNYKGKVICHAENHPPVSVNVNLKIWDFKIPEVP